MKLKPIHEIMTNYCQNIDQKWDKNKNNGFGFDGQNLIIKFNKMNQNEWNLIIKLSENQWNPDPNLSQIQKKINSKSAIFHPNPDKIDEKWDKNKNNGFGLEQPNLIIKLANFERKSMKNQWNFR